MDMMSVDDIAGRIATGSRLALPHGGLGVAMAVTRALLRHRPKDLHLICVPAGGLQADMLIGAGLVSTLETSAIGLGEAGRAPCFHRAVTDGAVRLLDSTCPALLGALVAAQKGAPFAAIRGLLGTDVLANRADWRVIDNPFGEDDPVVLLPALRPDVAIFHARAADREGNVWIGRHKELATMAYASRSTYVTVEEIVDGNLIADEDRSAGVLPGLYVDGIAVAPRGAWPACLPGSYAADSREVQAYAEAAKTPEGFAAYADKCASSLAPA